MTHLAGVFSAAIAEDTVTTTVAVLPIGQFDTGKYGKVDITQEMADEIVANWTAKVLKTDIRFDIGHAMEEAAGWITGLAVGTFAHPVSGASLPGIIATVEWTATGRQMLSDKQYRYVSSYLSSYKDEETGTVYNNVLMAVALCNDPVMRMLPPVELADPPQGEPCVLGEVVDAVAKRIGEREDERPPAELQAAQWGSWPAFAAMEDLIRKAIADGVTGDALRTKIAELAADLPEAIAVAIEAAVEAANADEGATVEVVEVVPQEDPLSPSFADTGDDVPDSEDLLARFDALMSECDGIVRGTAGVRPMRALAKETRSKLADLLTKKGGTTKMSQTPEEIALAEENNRLATELAARDRKDRHAKIDAALDKLSDKGMTEPARKILASILKADDREAIVLSEGADAVGSADAVLAFADAVQFVPVETPAPAGSQPNDGNEVELSDAEIEVGRQLGLTLAQIKAAKTNQKEA